MGNKAKSEKDMQTLILSCDIQHTSEGEETWHWSLTAVQIGTLQQEYSS